MVKPEDSQGAVDLDGIDLAFADQLARGYGDRGAQPGLAYGIVAGGRLVHSGGWGEKWLGGPVPDASTVFRIASMTKSFTASTVQLLREQGALRLDDLAADYVGELADLRLPTGDSPRLTVRHLLTMAGGFPADDPWGDRQQGLPPADFAELLKGGVRFAWTPGTRFEYSNLGYAILGRIIERITGQQYSEAVRSLILKPLGLTSTGYDVSEFASEQLARGYQHGSGGWHELEPDPNGAFAPMGGVFSTVADLAIWVTGFADAFPPRDGADSGHPLSRTARREMQLPQLAIITRRALSFPDASTMSYGYGLFVEEDASFGTIVHHSGGYPGFGTQMRWHPATGVGVIVLANGTYAPTGQLAGRIHGDLLRQLAAIGTGARTSRADGIAVLGPAPGDGGPWPETVTASHQVEKLLTSWDDDVAAALFTPNVDWDQPYPDRREASRKVAERIGAFKRDADRAAESDSAAHLRWWLRGERGVVQAEVRLAPLAESRVIWVRLAVPPAPGSVLLRMLDSLIGMLNDGAEQWPDWLPTADDVNTAHVARRLRVAAAWAGRCTVSAYLGGDGDSSATVELEGPDGRVALSVTVDEANEIIRQADVALRL